MKVTSCRLHVATLDMKHQTPTASIIHRCSRTVDFKCAILDELIDLEIAGVLFPQKVLLRKHTHISQHNLSKWSKARNSLMRARVDGFGHLRHVVTVSKVKYPEIENELYVCFLWRRNILGLPVDGDWLKRQMKVLLRQYHPIDSSSFKYSEGWLNRFKQRYFISYQAKTMKKAQPIQVRLPMIKSFHRWLLHTLQRSGVQRCRKYGRFPASHMFHCDQSPLPFARIKARSLNSIGKPCFIQMPHGSGLDKRQASLQLCIRAEGEQLVRIAIIMRGTGVRLCKEEKEAYARLRPFIAVYFQPKAWVDSAINLIWFKQFVTETNSLSGEKLLGMDRHGPQTTEIFKSIMQNHNTVPAYTPPDCTDSVAPCDHHVFARIKKIISRLYDIALDGNRESWCNPPEFGGLRAWQRRVYLATWAAVAWDIVKRDKDFLRSSFISTGWLIAKDGSENNKIKVDGVVNYDFTSDRV